MAASVANGRILRSRIIRYNPGFTGSGGMTNFQLVLRMARFIRPVRQTAAIACLLVAVWVLIELRATQLTGGIISSVKAAVDRGAGGAGVNGTFAQAIK